MAKVSPLMLAPPVIFVVIAGLFGFGMFRDDPDGLPSTHIGRSAPSIERIDEVSSLNGINSISDSDLRSGELTILNFWASWCPPCRAEHPRLIELSEQGYRVGSVNFKDTEDDAIGFLQELGNPFFGVAYDPRSNIAIDWGVIAPPETFLVNGEGIVLYRHIGPLVGSDFEQRFLPALRQANSN